MFISEAQAGVGRRSAAAPEQRQLSGYARLWCSIISLLLACSTTAAELSVQLRPTLGQTAIPQNTIVSRDGSGLPAGQGTALLGQPLYAAKCAACHGTDGKQPGNALAGGQGSLASARPNKTVGSYWPYATTLFDYINRAMPYDQPQSLSADEVYGVVAYVLFLNDIVDANQLLDQSNLARIEMPNRHGFVELAAEQTAEPRGQEVKDQHQ